MDLSVDELDAAAEKLTLLHRRNIRRDKHEHYWHRHTALDASSVARSIYAENVLRLMRRDIRRREGILVDEEDLAAAVHSMFSLEAREKIGPVRIRRRRSPKETTPEVGPLGTPTMPAAVGNLATKDNPAPAPVAPASTKN